MTATAQILELHSQGLTPTVIATQLGCKRNLVYAVLSRANLATNKRAESWLCNDPKCSTAIDQHGQLTYQQIAKLMGVSTYGAQTILESAEAKLGRWIEKQGITEAAQLRRLLAIAFHQLDLERKH